MKKIFALIMVMSILGSIVAGCSKADDGGTTGTTSTATTAGETK